MIKPTKIPFYNVNNYLFACPSKDIWCIENLEKIHATSLLRKSKDNTALPVIVDFDISYHPEIILKTIL